MSGMRATGLLHMGHMAGALSNWVRLQDDYECYYFIADWHALTFNYADSANIAGYCYDTLGRRSRPPSGSASSPTCWNVPHIF